MTPSHPFADTASNKNTSYFFNSKSSYSQQDEDTLPPFRPGTNLSHYEIVKLLAKGGFGSVYHAIDYSSLRQVALKTSLHTINDDLRFNATKSCLQQEFQFCQHIIKGYTNQHEYTNANTNNLQSSSSITTNDNEDEDEDEDQFDWLPRIHSLGILQTPRGPISYMSMELLGPDIFQVINHEEGPSIHLSDGGHGFYAFAVPMLRCLQKLHQLGFVHCDIKPENFVLQQDFQFTAFFFDNNNYNKKKKQTITTVPQLPQPKLIDFSFVQPYGNQPPFPSSKQLNGFCGTDFYASPNQLLRERVISPRDDLFSLGLTLLAMWTTKLPWSDNGFMEWRENKMTMEKIKDRMNTTTNNNMGEILTRGGGKNDDDANANDDDGAFDMPAPPTVVQPNNNHYSTVYEHLVSIHHRHSRADFKAFVEYRGEMYAKAVDDGNVPPFIQRWLEYCQSEGGGEYSDDDYEYLGGLLRGAPIEPPSSWLKSLLKRRGGHGGRGDGKQKTQRINTTAEE